MVFFLSGPSDGEFLQSDFRRWSRRNAQEAGAGDGEEQHRVDPEERGRDPSVAREQCVLEPEPEPEPSSLKLRKCTPGGTKTVVFDSALRKL